MNSICLPEWVHERAQQMPKVERLELRKTALLVVDLQNYFVDAGYLFTVSNAVEVVPNVNRLARTLRSYGGTVVWLRHTFSNKKPFAVPAWYDTAAFIGDARENLVPGSPGHDLYRQLEVESCDLIVNKYRLSAFFSNSSNIDALLRDRDIDTVIVTGTLTNGCCECSARDALMLDYRVLFASDATAAITDEEHNATLLNLALTFVDVRSTSEILDLMVRSVRS